MYMIAQDKSMHFIVGNFIGAGAALIAVAAGHPELARTAALVASGAAGATKEGLDAYLNKQARKRGELPKHGSVFADYAATQLGGLNVAGILSIG